MSTTRRGFIVGSAAVAAAAALTHVIPTLIEGKKISPAALRHYHTYALVDGPADMVPTISRMVMNDGVNRMMHVYGSIRQTCIIDKVYDGERRFVACRIYLNMDRDFEGYTPHRVWMPRPEMGVNFHGEPHQYIKAFIPQDQLIFRVHPLHVHSRPEYQGDVRRMLMRINRELEIVGRSHGVEKLS